MSERVIRRSDVSVAKEMLTGMPVFVRVAETRSFTGAARQLGISPSGVSKAVSRLEERLGMQLLERTTRSVTLTDDGAVFYERCRQILADIEDAHAQATEARAAPRGTVRASVPAALGRLHLVPALPRLLSRHPGLDVRLELTDRRVDVVAEGLDVGVRIGKEVPDPQRRLVRRVVATSRGVVCASPAYVERFGRPRKPEDLTKHNVCLYGPPHGEATRTWTFRRGEQRRRTTVRGNVTLDSGDALVDLARAGHGIIAVFDFLASPAVRAGELVVLLPRWEVWPGLPISVVYPKHRKLSAKVRVFSEFVSEAVGQALTTR